MIAAATISACVNVNISSQAIDRAHLSVYVWRDFIKRKNLQTLCER